MRYALAGIVVVALAAAGWYFLSPLFIDEVVNEAFPEAGSATEPSEADTLKMSTTTPEADASPETDASASAEPQTLARGSFVDADAIHKGSGTATIYQLADGSHVLRFEDFSVTNGPGLHVLLSAHPEPRSSGETKDSGYLDLGALKGNQGDQNYAIPAGTDLSAYQSVVIYCYPFNVVFSTATITQ